MPLTYSFAADWDGTSLDPHDDTRVNDNHSSARDKTEVERLVKEGLAFLRRAAKKDLKQEGLKFIREVMIADSGTVEIEKGIHQRMTEPHIRAKVSKGGKSWTAHIHLSEQGLPGATGGTGMFAWKAVAVSVNKDQLYPATVIVGARKRRDSVDFSVLDSERRRLAEEARKNAPVLPVVNAWGKPPVMAATAM